ncbi:hypothetical protein [Corallincola spongiicola]|uniref:DUF1311 domain-containing protein n=1 Tax=Corallincola spongiicola TaxID=2520508 RepID=A0ABY1WQ69_9GAMM|nr:hypothetical protein [Corallincola spongiicola]TAA46775.1 hypothetical protein EXY25_05840 [Corallincola spongiicola]
MNFLIRLFGIYMLFYSGLLHSEQPPSHPLDAYQAACPLNNPQPVQLAECYIDVVDEWRDEVERVYDFVLERKVAQKRFQEAKLIKQAQTNFLAYRKLVATQWQNSCNGSAACQVQLPELELVAQRERYFQLEAYVDCINCFPSYK